MLVTHKMNIIDTSAQSNIEFKPDKKDFSQYILKLLKNNKSFRFQLGIKINANTRSINPIKHCAEIISGMTFLPIGNVFLALRNTDLIFEIAKAKYECLDKITNDQFDNATLLLGGSKTKRVTTTNDDGEIVNETTTFRLSPKLIEGIFTNMTPPVGTEMVEQLMLPMKFPDEFAEASTEDFELMNARIKLNIERKLTKSQKEVFNRYRESKKRIHILDGCVRAGKSYVATYLALLDIEEHISKKNGGQIVFMGVSANTLYANVFKGIINELFELDIPAPQSYVWKLANQNIRIIGACKESMKGLRGITATRIFIDEGQNAFNNDYAMLTVETRMAKPNVKMMLTCNTDAPSHPLYERYLKDPSKYDELSVERYHFNLLDEVKNGNPHIEADFPAHIGRVFGVDSAHYKKDVLGEWVGADDAVYKFSIDRDVINKEDIRLECYDDIYIGVDQGTNSPRVYIMIGVYIDILTGKKKVHVIDELYYKRGHGHIKKYHEYIEELERFVAPVKSKLRAIYTPHDANDLKMLLRDQMELPSELANGKIKVVEGIGMIQHLLGAEFLKVSSKCENLIKEMMIYRYETKDGEAKEKIQKDNDHAPDALRYAITSCGVYCSGTYEMFKYITG